MDPLSVLGTVITIIQIAQIIKASIDKVAGNKSRLLNLTEDIVHGLDNLEKFSRRHGEILNGSSELKDALSNLKTEMSLLLVRCQKLLPRCNGSHISKVKAKVKTWQRRDDIEAEMNQMKERITACYSQFTAFTAARVEHTSLRIENSLVVRGVEHQAHLNRLETLMTRMLLDSKFGQQIVQKVGQILATDYTHQSLEHDYLRLQLNRVVDSIEALPNLNSVLYEEPSARHELPFEPYYQPLVTHETIVSEVLIISRKIRERPYDLSIQDGAMDLQDIAIYLNDLHFSREGIVIQKLVVRMYRYLASGNSRAFLPRLAHALKNLSAYQQNTGDMEDSLSSSESSVAAIRLINETYPDLDFRALLAFGLRTYSDSLRYAGLYEEAIPSAEESVGIYAKLIEEIDSRVDGKTPNYTTIYAGARACMAYCQALINVQRYGDAYNAVKQGMHLLTLLPKEEVLKTHLRNTPQEAFRLVFLSLVAIYETKAASLSLAEDVVVIYHLLAQTHPSLFSTYFLRAFYAYSYLCDIGQKSNTSLVELEAGQIDVFRSVFLDHNYSATTTDTTTTKRPPKSFHASIHRLQQHDQGLVVITDAISVYLSLRSDPCFPTPSLTENIHAFIVALLGAHFEDAIKSVQKFIDELLVLKGDHHYLYIRILSCLCDVGSTIEEVSKPTLVSLAKELIANARIALDDQDLAKALRIYGYVLTNCTSQTDGMKTVEESISLYQSILPDSPNVRLEYTYTLKEYARFLHGAGRLGDALKFYQAAVEQCMESRGDQSLEEPFISLYITTMAQLSDCLFLLGYHDQAIAVCREAIDVSVPLEHVSDFCPSSLLMTMSINLFGIGRYQEALTFSEEALSFCSNPDPTQDLPKFLPAYEMMSRCRLALGHYEKVLEIVDKSCAFFKGNSELKIDWMSLGLPFDTLAMLSSHAAKVDRIDDALLIARVAIQCYATSGLRESPAIGKYINAVCEVCSSAWNSGHQNDALALLDGVAYTQFTAAIKDGEVHLHLHQASCIEAKKRVTTEDIYAWDGTRILVTVDESSFGSKDTPSYRSLDVSLDSLVRNITNLLQKSLPSDPLCYEVIEFEQLPCVDVSPPVVDGTQCPANEEKITLDRTSDISLLQPRDLDSSEQIPSTTSEDDRTTLHHTPSNIFPHLYPSCSSNPSTRVPRNYWKTVKDGSTMLANVLVIFWTLAMLWNLFQSSTEGRISTLDRIAAAIAFR